MTTPVYKLTDEEISDKASTIIRKLHSNGKINDREEQILRSCVSRYFRECARVKTTEKWAQEAFDEQKRLTALLKERWEAGWQGNPTDEPRSK